MDEDAIRQLVEEQIAATEALVEQSEAATKPVELDQQKVGRLSRMDAMQMREMNVETQRRRRIGLARLRAALARLEAGTFGECLECGEDIAEKRLHHDPGHTRCIECARSAERS